MKKSKTNKYVSENNTLRSFNSISKFWNSNPQSVNTPIYKIKNIYLVFTNSTVI